MFVRQTCTYYLRMRAMTSYGTYRLCARVQTVNQGQMFEFALKVTGKKPLTVTWYRNETTKLKSSKKSKVAYSSSTGEIKLVVMESEAEDDGEYKLVVSNDLGEVVQTCRVTIVCKYHCDSGASCFM